MLRNLTLLQREKLVKFLAYYFMASKKHAGFCEIIFRGTFKHFYFREEYRKAQKRQKKRSISVEKIIVDERGPRKKSTKDIADRSYRKTSRSRVRNVIEADPTRVTYPRYPRDERYSANGTWESRRENRREKPVAGRSAPFGHRRIHRYRCHCNGDDDVEWRLS